MTNQSANDWSILFHLDLQLTWVQCTGGGSETSRRRLSTRSPTACTPPTLSASTPSASHGTSHTNQLLGETRRQISSSVRRCFGTEERRLPVRDGGPPNPSVRRWCGGLRRRSVVLDEDGVSAQKDLAVILMFSGLFCKKTGWM